MHERTISPETAEANALIRSLVESYIDHPDALAINVRDYGSQVYWVLQCHADDMRKMVGADRGAHVAALEHLVKAMGRARQVVHTFRLLEPAEGVRREEYPEHVAKDFDPAPAAARLREIVLALGIDEVAVVTSKLSAPLERPLSFAFQVHVRTVEDYESLIVSPPKARNGLTAIAAIGTLYRAAEHKSGVKFTVSVVDPSKQ